jgi:F-type H+-transporting ATPase subunit a
LASDGRAAPAAETVKAGGKNRSLLRNPLVLLAIAVIAVDVLAFIVAPPFPRDGQPGEACPYPVCFINGNLEFVPPTVVWDLDPANPAPTGSMVITFHPSITNTLLLMWIVMAIVLFVSIVAARRRQERPGGLQNFFEWSYESLYNWAVSNGGNSAARHAPIFAAFFILILFCNWSGLVPPVGKIEALRAPTSDLNITIGLALVAFIYFEFHGFRANGVRGYVGKFLPFGEFRHGLGAGLLALFVGLIELLLELVKPLTLSMRLFGNIYGGEVALGVLTALTVAIVPMAILGLELMLNFIQALIFSTLTLLFTMVAIESTHGDDHAPSTAPAPGLPVEAPGQPPPAPAPAH